MSLIVRIPRADADYCHSAQEENSFRKCLPFPPNQVLFFAGGNVTSVSRGVGRSRFPWPTPLENSLAGRDRCLPGPISLLQNPRDRTARVSFLWTSFVFFCIAARSPACGATGSAVSFCEDRPPSSVAYLAKIERRRLFVPLVSLLSSLSLPLSLSFFSRIRVTAAGKRIP